MTVRPEPGTRRFLLLFVAPLMLLLAWRVAPLVAGARTLYLRDVFGTHLEMKWAVAEAWRHGRVPFIDPYRAGGQPLLGSPNSLALYPDTVLYLMAPALAGSDSLAGTLWAHNAHFWLHLLVAPLAFFWMARAWGLGREAAWAGGALYGLSGWFLSQLMFYNLIGGAALLPALIAAAIRLAEEPRRPGRLVIAALLWALLLLAGDPFTALVALLLAAAAVIATPARGPGCWRRVLAAAICGTLLAAPFLVEFLRILRHSYRGFAGYSAETVLTASWEPRQLVEWLLPLVYGRPGWYGAGLSPAGPPPYFFSLAPGLLAAALLVPGALSVARAARGSSHHRAGRFALAAAAVGLFFALGRLNPIAAALLSHGGLVRFPVRFWILVAVGSSLLAAAGFEAAVRDRDSGARRAFHIGLGLLACMLLAALAALWLRPESCARLLLPRVPAGPLSFEYRVVLRQWIETALVSLVALVLLGAGAILARRRPRAGGAALLAAHAATQLVLLAPIMPTDVIGPYATPPPVLDVIPDEARIVHGVSEGLFGAPGSRRRLLDRTQAAFWRDAFEGAFPFAGIPRRRHYELNVSSEGMDSFLSTAARDAVRPAGDAARLRLLRAWGVDRLLLDRELDPGAGGGAALLRRFDLDGGPLDVYELAGAAPPALWTSTIRRASDPRAAVAALLSPAFDPATMVVMPGAGPDTTGPPGGAVRLVIDEPQRIAVEVSAPVDGVLVLQRSWQPIDRATVDGAPAALLAANLHRIGVPVPAGDHRVEVGVDRRPFFAALVLAFAGVTALSFAVVAPRLRRSAGAAVR